MKRLLLPLSLLLFPACRQGGDPEKDDEPKVDTAGLDLLDTDLDGFKESEGDCNDDDASVYPSAEEVCDEKDNNCDGTVDEGVTQTWYQDSDGDSYGDAATATTGCSPEAGSSAMDGDCDDGDAATYPGAPEDCTEAVDRNCDGSVGLVDADQDGVPACEDCNDANPFVSPLASEVCDASDLDEDCDGLSDDADDSVLSSSMSTTYADSDQDGYGNADAATVACDGVGVTTAGDCNDTDPLYNPGMAELDCTDPNDYNCDGSVGYSDADGDGYAACQECDDAQAAINPGATEVCNTVDDDCDGSVDEEGGVQTWYADADGDGYGDPNVGIVGCTAPTGYLADASDCNDNNATINPAGSEVCNGLDDNCDGSVDEGASDALTWYTDADGDGFGDTATAVQACSAPAGTVAVDGDCNDGDAAYNPAATESDCADPNDYNCDGQVAYADADADGWAACEDCNDADAAVNPSAAEVCNSVDDDCSGAADDNAVDAATWYADSDGDSWGDTNVILLSCTAPSGFVANNQDCSDIDYSINPAGTERCNGVDDDCDGTIDEADATDAAIWYADSDGDGFGDPAATLPSCTPPAGYVSSAGDCDDTEVGISPFATELCNGADDDCDGSIDEADAADAATWYVDADGDGQGDPAQGTRSCTAPAGSVSNNTDCDDAASTVYVGAPERCDGVDEDCNGLVDDNAIDATSFHLDGDCDGYGEATGVIACTSPGVDYVTDATDCDDGDGRDAPGAPERCDGLDNDCDGTTDESCVTSITVSTAAYAEVNSAANASACGRFAELNISTDPHYTANLSTYMAGLDGGSGFRSAVEIDVTLMDYSIRSGSNYSIVSPGNFSGTQAWPVVSLSGSVGAARFRGYINLRCGEELNRTIGLIGNDAMSLSIAGTTITSNQWSSGQWKTFRYVSFPGPGLYPFEVQWSTNFVYDIDPFELIWAEGFLAGYDNYNTMCSGSFCTYGNNQPIPDFSVLASSNLAQSSTGADTSCEQCATTADCSAGVCNTAGICE